MDLIIIIIIIGRSCRRMRRVRWSTSKRPNIVRWQLLRTFQASTTGSKTMCQKSCYHYFILTYICIYLLALSIYRYVASACSSFHVATKHEIVWNAFLDWKKVSNNLAFGNQQEIKVQCRNMFNLYICKLMYINMLYSCNIKCIGFSSITLFPPLLQRIQISIISHVVVAIRLGIRIWYR